MGSKLYVGNINYATTEDELRELFGSYGPVSAVDVVRDRYTGQSKGFAFVHFEDPTHAEQAIQGLNETEVGGRTNRVDAARESSNRAGGFGR